MTMCLHLRLSASMSVSMPTFPSSIHTHINPNINIPSPSPSVRLRSASSSSSDSGVLFRQKVQFLEQQLGLDPFLTLSLNPDLRSLPISSLHSLRSLLLSFGLRRPRDTARVLSMFPHLLTSDPLLLLPVLRFLLHTLRLSPTPHALRSAVLRCPRLLVSSVDRQLLPTLYFLRRLGFVGPRRIDSHTALLLVSSVEGTLIPKLDYLQSLGFSSREAVKMVLRCPGLFTLSIDRNFRPKAHFLVTGMGRDIAEVRDFPQYFSFSLEKRIKPRHMLLVEHGFQRMPLSQMLKASDGEFGDMLVEMRLRSVEGRM